MADLNAKILPLRTETAGRVPDDATMASLSKDALEVGEIAMNIADQKIFTKDSGGNIVEMASPPVVALSGLTDVDLTTLPPVTDSILAYDQAASKWKSGPLEPFIVNSRDYSEEERQPERLQYDEDSVMAAGVYIRPSSSTLDVHRIDKFGVDQYKFFDSLPNAGTLFTSGDNASFLTSTYTTKTYNAVLEKFVFGGLSAAVTATPALYLTFRQPLTDAPQLPRIGELLSWDGAGWTPAPITGSIPYPLDSLADVTASAPTSGQILAYDGTGWVASNPTAASGSVGDLSDVDITTAAPADGQVLVWVAASSQFEPGDAVSRIQDASDFALNQDGGGQDIALAAGDVLAWDDVDQKFKPSQSAGGAGDLGDLGDVDLVTNLPQDGNQLIYDSAQGLWVPSGVTAGRLTARTDEIETTASVADGLSADLTFDGIGEVGEMVQITVSEPAWVRFYPTAADRSADGSRANDTDPTPGSGVLLELLTTTSNQVVKVTPGASYYNNDSPSVAAVYCRVTNLSGAAAAISVTVRAFAQVSFDGFNGGTYGSG